MKSSDDKEFCGEYLKDYKVGLSFPSINYKETVSVLEVEGFSKKELTAKRVEKPQYILNFEANWKKNGD